MRELKNITSIVPFRRISVALFTLSTQQGLKMSTEVKSLHDDLLSQFVAGNQPLDGKSVSLTFVRVLNVSPGAKCISIECTYKDQPAILVLEKTAFEEEVTKQIASNFGEVLENVKNIFRNDIYGSYLMDISLKDAEKNNINKIAIRIIHPATQRDIEKYMNHPYFFVFETADLYKTVTKPFIEKLVTTPGHLQWVYNILEHKKEVDRIVYEENIDNENGFILVKDMKWKIDKEVLSDLEKLEIYINAFVVRRDLHSLRDLNQDHLPLLEGIFTRGRKAIAEKFSLDEKELRAFIHYQPSFYHLHVHFTHIKSEHPSSQTERAHMLSSVIENIRLMGDYYQKVGIEFPLSNSHELKREQFQ